MHPINYLRFGQKWYFCRFLWIKCFIYRFVSILGERYTHGHVFDFVKKEYSLNNPNSNQLIFSGWKNRLKIELQDSTSILSVTYSDGNKELIIPVLERISNEYKKYSGKNKRKNLRIAKEYLNNQIQVYKVKSSESLKKAQEYAIDQDLTTLNLNFN